jgi:hypothetical protein
LFCKLTVIYLTSQAGWPGRYEFEF